MKKGLVLLSLVSFLVWGWGCAGVPRDRYNTQRGAATGAAIGAIAGQIFKHSTAGTLAGAAIGTVAGALVGNVLDQSYQERAVMEAANSGKRIVYRDQRGCAVEAIPGEVNQQTRCRKVTKRVWIDGKMTETVEEVCEGTKIEDRY